MPFLLMRDGINDGNDDGMVKVMVLLILMVMLKPVGCCQLVGS